MVTVTQSIERGKKSGLWKYDGHSYYSAGLLQAITPTATAGPGIGNLTEGTYKYMVVYKYIDNRGNLIYGNSSLLRGERTIEATGVNNTGSITTNNPIMLLVDDPIPFNYNTAQVDGGGSPITLAAGTGDRTITVDAATHTLRVGDWATFAVTGDTVYSFRIKEKTATTIVINKTDDALLSLPDNNTISSGFTVDIYRTKQDGQTYYLLVSLPIKPPPTAAITYTDVTADNDLGTEWLGPYTGRLRRDVPPVMGVIERHQGGLAGAGDPENGETLYWSGTHPEYWPTGTHNADIGSEQGKITALASDSIDTLLAFKEDAIINVSGDLHFLAFSVSSYDEGDVGSPSPGGWVKVRQGLLVMSSKGPRFIRAGEVSDYDERLIPYFYNNKYQQTVSTEVLDANKDKLVLSRVVSAHDKDDRKLYYFIPAETYPMLANSNSLLVVVDYSHNTWSVYTYPEDHLPNGGMDFYDNTLYWLSRTENGSYSTAKAILYKSNKTQTKYDYTDNTEAISALWRPQWEYMGEPSIDKEFNTLKIWSLGATPFASFTLGVKTYRNFSNDTADTETTVDFSAATTLDATIDLVLNRAKALQLEFSNSTKFEPIRITGYEISVAAPYRKEGIEDEQG